MVLATAENSDGELERKLALVRGVDWFAWGTCGGSSVVILGAEVGVAELVVTSSDVCVLTDARGDRARPRPPAPTRRPPARHRRSAGARWASDAGGLYANLTRFIYFRLSVARRAGAQTRLARHGAVAWNPSVAGARIEDTVRIGDGGVEVLTSDAVWPARAVGGRTRPDVRRVHT